MRRVFAPSRLRLSRPPMHSACKQLALRGHQAYTPAIRHFTMLPPLPAIPPPNAAPNSGTPVDARTSEEKLVEVLTKSVRVCEGQGSAGRACTRSAV